MTLYLGNKKIAGLADGIQVIGEIKYIPCASNYVPSGCLPCDGAEYDKSQFVDLWNKYLVVNPQTQTLYGWDSGVNCYTLSATPSVGDYVYLYINGKLSNYRTISEVASDYSSITFSEGESADRLSDTDMSVITSFSSKLSICTYAEYAADIAASGQCGKFGVDANANIFKVPTLPNRLITGVGDTAGVRGTGKSIGFTDGTTEYTGRFFTYSGVGLTGIMSTDTQVSLPNSSNTGDPGYANLGTKAWGLSTDSSKSGIVAEPKVQSIAARAFVVVANGQINQSQMDWSAWAAGLQGKANNSLENVTDAGKLAGINWLMPDYSAGVTYAAGTVHTATVPGWVMFKTTGIPQSQAIKINGVEFALGSKGNYGTCYDTMQEFIPVSAGDTFYLDNLGTPTIIFYPCKGV